MEQIETILVRGSDVYPDPLFSTDIVQPLNNNMPDKIHFEIPPFNQFSLLELSKNTLQFNINSSNLLDPYSLYLEIEIENINNNPIQLDGSAHSLISEILVRANGEDVEEITEYDFLTNLQFDMSLTRDQRARRHEHEGFGYNSYGTNETIIYESSYNNRLVKGNPYSKLINAYNKFKGYRPLAEELLNNTRENTTLASAFDFEKMAGDHFYAGQNYKHINDWDVVEGGVVRPLPIHKERYVENYKYNIKTFKIPLMLKSIGFGIPVNHYKLIPLILFPNMYLSIKINPDAFFVPVELNVAEFFGLGEDGKRETFLREKFKMGINNLFRVNSVKLHMDQYIFHPSVHDTLISQIRNGSQRWEYKDLEIIDHIQTQNKNEYHIERNDTKKNIKSIMVIWRNDLHIYCKMARKQARYNRDFSQILFSQAGNDFPAKKSDYYDSVSTHGAKNAFYFYQNFMNLNTGRDFNKTLCSYRNYCINFDYSHIAALHWLQTFKNTTIAGPMRFSELLQKNDVNFDGNSIQAYEFEDAYATVINSYALEPLRYMRLPIHDYASAFAQPTSKCIHTINFDTTPYIGGKYKFMGIETQRNVPYHIKMVRTKEAQQRDILRGCESLIFWTCTIIFERHKVFTLGEGRAEISEID